MALRGKKPTEVKKRLKALFYGDPGVGKTMCSIQFPAPYLIDTERGSENSQYVEILSRQNGAVFHTSDFDEIMEEVKSLLTTKHDYKTLIIDPITVIYDSLLDKAADKVGTDFQKHKHVANRQMKRLINLLYRLDMNVIMTSHPKKKWGDGFVALGQTFDCYDKIEHVYDLLIHVERRGKERIGIVKKTRIKTFEEDSQFPFNYQTIADKYGRDIIEKNSEVQEFLSPEETKELKNLINIFKVPIETVTKWLDKAHASCIEEMPRDYGQKCIAFLKEQVKSTAAEVATT